MSYIFLIVYGIMCLWDDGIMGLWDDGIIIIYRTLYLYKYQY